jgi:hypothetical protein
MDDQDFTRLYYLAQALADDPARFEEHFAVARADAKRSLVQSEAPQEAGELAEAIDLLERACREEAAKQGGQGLTLEGVIAVAKDLQAREEPPSQLAGHVLSSAVESRLSRKREAGVLEKGEEKLLGDLPKIAAS